MNRINRIFSERSHGLLSLYFCAGHPTPDSTVPIIKTLARRGIDFIEVGIPFSDPMADGPVIQDAATTGMQREFDAAKQAYFSRVEQMGLRHPRMIGFGISNRQTLEAAQRNAAGAIIGSKFVTLLDELKDPDAALDALMKALQS